MQIVQPITTICATPRLARALQLNTMVVNHQSPTPKPIQAQPILTLQQWLTNYCNFAELAGEIAPDYFSPHTLTPFSEAVLWQQAIAQHLSTHDLKELFDVPSMAQSAISANQLLINWQIDEAQLNDYFNSTETRQLMRWRNTFFGLCAQHQTVTPAWLIKQQIEAVSHCNYPLPAHMQWVGFDRITPLLQSLLNTLQAKGVQITIDALPAQQAQASQIKLLDTHAECRAAVAWVKAALSQNPQANLAIISPSLSNIQRPLADLLDDTFHPETLLANQYEAPRLYDFSVGDALSEHALCRTAFNCLRLASTSKNTTQPEMSALLLDVNWSELQELDARSLADAKLRKQLNRTFGLLALLRLIEENSAIKYLQAHLKLILETQRAWQKKQHPSQWVKAFVTLLNDLNWAQTRALSSHEFQAKQKWDVLLESFAQLDGLTKQISAFEAVQKLQSLAKNTMFLPESIGDVRLQLLGMYENIAKPIDGIWVMGMNDHQWPPPSELNPLLPSALQRDLQTPGATPNVQSEFAQKIHARLLNSACEVIFSWSQTEGERELRASPLLVGLPMLAYAPSLQTMAETLAVPMTMQMLNDSVAPALSFEEKPRGGVQLLAAQAICPAWAFYQYRLGANALEAPSDGLDSMVRGNLVHAVLQHFWLACKDSTTLKQLSGEAQNNMVQSAISQALLAIAPTLPAQLISIEQKRLSALIHAWLTFEKERNHFTVKACEAHFPIHIAGLDINCRIDRIDALANDSLVIIDYKTGSSDAVMKSWAEARIKVPQLPLYAAIALKASALKESEVAAVCFAKVHIDECKLTGLSQLDDLPSITPFDALSDSSPFKAFGNMPTLIEYWRTNLEHIAEEIAGGKAGVVFEDESDLIYCKVRPLLRLAERQLQFEMDASK